MTPRRPGPDPADVDALVATLGAAVHGRIDRHDAARRRALDDACRTLGVPAPQWPPVDAVVPPAVAAALDDLHDLGRALHRWVADTTRLLDAADDEVLVRVTRLGAAPEGAVRALDAPDDRYVGRHRGELRLVRRQPPSTSPAEIRLPDASAPDEGARVIRLAR